MTETVKRRRRWPWLVLSATLLLACVPIAWRLRPLNTAERALLGDWTALEGLDGSVRTSTTFYADRTFAMDEELVGSWNASTSVVRLHTPLTLAQTAGYPWHIRLGVFIESRLASKSVEIQWDGPNRFTIKEGPPYNRETVFERGTAEPLVADLPVAPPE